MLIKTLINNSRKAVLAVTCKISRILDDIEDDYFDSAMFSFPTDI